MTSPRNDWLQVWHVNPSANKDYDFIDGLRGIAILLVVFGHLVYNIPESSSAIRFTGLLVRAGGFGVFLFFALSGFLISWPFWKRKIKGADRVVPPGYSWRRFWKIYPPLVLSVAALTPAYVLLTNDPAYLGPALQWVLGVPLVRPVNGDFNPVMWSLIVEMHFYIVLPLLFLSLKRVSARTCLWLIPLLFFVIPVAWRWYNLARGIHFDLHPNVNVHFPSLLDNFALGVLIAGLENMGLLRKSWAKFGDAGLVLLALVLLSVPVLALYTRYDTDQRFEIIGWGVRIASGLLLLFVANPDHPRSQLLSANWLRWCGIISYEWYLFHQPMVSWAHTLFGPAQGGFLKFAVITGVTFGSSILLAATVYRLFSLPILRFGRGNHPVPKPQPVAVYR